MKINIIASVSENWAIGKNNKLPWNQSSDLEHFKEITTRHPIIMGQKTFESLPNGALPNRTNIVLTDNFDFSAPNILIAYNIAEALILAEDNCATEDCDIFIIGGGTIYRQFLPYADRIYLTIIHTEIEGDTYFPEINLDEWLLVSKYTENKNAPCNQNKKNDYDWTFSVYDRIYYDTDELIEKELTEKEKEERKSGKSEMCGFVDWNKFSLDFLADYLENKYRFSSSGEALAIFKLVEFYRNNK